MVSKKLPSKTTVRMLFPYRQLFLGLMFSTRSNLALAAEAPSLYVDWTFQICPHLFYQVFTILLPASWKEGMPLTLCSGHMEKDARSWTTGLQGRWWVHVLCELHDSLCSTNVPNGGLERFEGGGSSICQPGSFSGYRIEGNFCEYKFSWITNKHGRKKFCEFWFRDLWPHPLIFTHVLAILPGNSACVSTPKW